MRTLIQQLVEQSPGENATILMVGAGNGAELPLLRQLGGSRLVLVEAHSGQAEVLARRIDPARGEEVWPRAITGAAVEQATLHVVNNPGFSSLKSPMGLVEHFPNLREIRQSSVPARSLAESIETLVLDAAANHLLVLDAPGQAFDLLSATPPRALQSFARMIVRCGVEPLYADDKGMEEVLEVLRNIGFDAGSEDPEAIYPQTAVMLARNDTRVEKLRLETLVAQVSAECETQTLLANQRGQEIERLARGRDHATALAQKYKTELDAAIADTARIDKLTRIGDEQAKLTAQHKAELDKVAQAATEQQKLVADRDAQIQKLTQERDAQARRAAQDKAELDKVVQAAAQEQKLANDRHALIQKLTRERDDVAANLAEAQPEHDALKAGIAALNQELAEARRTSSLSLRLQTLREADLKDLQIRYQALTEKNEDQHRLLVKLSERLTVAADYFHQLTRTQQAIPAPGERIGGPVKAIKPQVPRRSPRKRTKAQ